MVQPEFYTDKDVAKRMGFSPEWVRGQRHKRANKLPHFLTLEPRRIGRSVRYVAPEVEAFIKAIVHQDNHAE
jgi:hypothetical protein